MTRHSQSIFCAIYQRYARQSLGWAQMPIYGQSHGAVVDMQRTTNLVSWVVGLSVEYQLPLAGIRAQVRKAAHNTAYSNWQGAKDAAHPVRRSCPSSGGLCGHVSGSDPVLDGRPCTELQFREKEYHTAVQLIETLFFPDPQSFIVFILFIWWSYSSRHVNARHNRSRTLGLYDGALCWIFLGMRLRLRHSISTGMHRGTRNSNIIKRKQLGSPVNRLMVSVMLKTGPWSKSMPVSQVVGVKTAIRLLLSNGITVL